MESHKELQPGEIIIKKVRAIGSWKFDGQDVCAICRNSLVEPCVECLSNGGGRDECKIAWGICMHPYHFHCIQKWLKTRESCPIDNSPWEFHSIGNIVQ